MSIVAIVGLAAAGCGSSSKSALAPAPTTSSVAGAKLSSDSPILLGNVGNLSNEQLGTQSDDSATPKAWIDYTNAHGGIDGHPVKLYQLDDGADPGRALVDVKQLVGSDHVIALVGDQDSATDTAYASYLTQAGVPNVGGADFSNVWFQNSDYFPTEATENTNSYALDYAAKFAGAKSFAVAYCSENPACLEGTQSEQADAASVGIKYIKGPSASSVAPSYTAQCLSMMSSHPDAIAFSDGVPQAEKMASDCRTQGFTGTWVLFQPDNTELTSSGVDKSAIGEDLQLPYFANIPATRTFRQAMAAYAKGVPIQIDSLRIWAAFDVLKAALEAEGTKALTPQAVKSGLYKLDGFTDQGIVPPLKYTAGKPTSNDCFIIWGIKDKKFTLPNGDKFTCEPG
jgi:branched-chain amino acid transport system substrate-binding protein